MMGNMPKSDTYGYELRWWRYPEGFAVVKRNLCSGNVVELLVSGLTLEVAEGFIKLLKEK
jgi:hypothetical protein